MKKEYNARIREALFNAKLAQCTLTMFIYIDGDPIHQRLIFLN